MVWSEQHYLYMQENGQMKYGGPPPNWVGPPPPKGTEVFISKIPRDAKLPEIVPIFAQAGDIYSARLMMDFSGSNRGFCFVQFRTIAMARDAVIYLNGYEMQGQKISVTKSIDNCRLFIGQIPKEKSKDEIEEILSSITSGVKEVILYLSPTDKSLNRGFCFVEYIDHRSAAMARRYLITSGIREWGREVRIDWAVPEGEIHEDIMAKVTVVYIRNLMLRTTETSIREVMCKVVTPDDFSRIRKVKDFAFVHFNSREAAEKTLHFLNGFTLDGARLYATWSKPLLEESFSNELNFDISSKKIGKTKSRKNQLKDTKDMVPVDPSYQLTPVTPITYRPPLPASPISSVCYSDSFPPYFGYPTTEPCASSGVPVFPLICPDNEQQQQYIEQKKISPRTIVFACLRVMPPALALQSIALHFGWGIVHFKITAEQGISSSNIVQFFTAQVLIVRQNKTFTYPELRHPSALTPDEAKNLAATVFIQAYLLKSDI